MTFFIRLSVLLLALSLLSSCGDSTKNKKAKAVVFPNAEFSKVVAYDYDPQKGENIYDFKKKELYHTIKKEQELSEEQINNLLAVLNDQNTYGGDVTRCFHPRLGVIFYDAQGKAKAQVSICFECNQHQASPSILAQQEAKAASAMSLHGYSNEGRQKLIDFCKSLNFSNCGKVEEENTETSSIQ